jgi:hypothetical protein
MSGSFMACYSGKDGQVPHPRYARVRNDKFTLGFK